MLENSDDFAIVTGVIGLAASFNREVIAEGVETVAHGRALLTLGCELAQGYGIARPMPANKIIKWSSDWKVNSEWLTIRKKI
jgi:EAL domain-containing protein (putative c-di-GMP-specific phosphodiesterase class I)